MRRRLSLLLIGLLLAALAGCGTQASAGNPSAKVQAVAAENFYGDLLRQLGGDRVGVTSILSNPNADPHEYESSPQDATLIADAKLVIMNGLGYDAWMQHLLDASPSGGRTVIDAGALTGYQTGGNPHIWYNVYAIERIARDVAAQLVKLDPSGTAQYRSREQRFETSLQPLLREMTLLRSRYAGQTVAATEPVFGYMLQNIGLIAPQTAFQHAVEEGADPPPQAVASFTDDLRGRRVRALIYNRQAVEPITQTMRSIARSERIPVIGVTETEPAGKDYQQWMLGELRQLAAALAR
jgi:zinc/manganese transport system substrate-binding protein